MNLILRSSVFVLFSSLMLSCGGSHDVEGPEVQVDGGWARAMPLIQEEGGAPMNSAVYLLLRNRGGSAHRLVGAETDAAERVEIHESRLVDDVMRMNEIDGVDVPPGGTVELRPGGIHLMLLGLTRALVDGDEIHLTLQFESLGELSVSVPVQLSGSG